MEDGKLKRRAWTTSEERLLVDGAGRIPPCEICRLLDRSESSIKAKAAELRRRGMEVSLRYYESDLVWCPKCATWRTKVFKRSGECIVCRLKERLARQEEKCSVSLSEMPDDAGQLFLPNSSKEGVLFLRNRSSRNRKIILHTAKRKRMPTTLCRSSNGKHPITGS